VLVVEHEAALLDGTPITVDGVPAPRAGERAVYFLVVGGTEALPFHAVVGPQGRYPLAGSALDTLADDPLAAEIAGLSVGGLRDALGRAGR
jgi:hypothetical protein